MFSPIVLLLTDLDFSLTLLSFVSRIFILAHNSASVFEVFRSACFTWSAANQNHLHRMM